VQAKQAQGLVQAHLESIFAKVIRVMNHHVSHPEGELFDRIRHFVCEKIIPYEKDPRVTAHGPTEDLRLELNGLARQAGLLSLHMGTEYGGMGLSYQQCAVAFEAAGYSMLGPIALNCVAPDEGNMHLLSEVATPAQKEAFLRPLASGIKRSCFGMTEPMPGAGSDPGMLSTQAVWNGEHYVIRGRKWLITGAQEAGFIILMAQTIVDGSAIGATMFLVPLPHPNIRITRQIDVMATSFTCGHAELEIDGLHVSPDAVLGEVGQGFRYAQVRLAPARLTHCMRWLGAAQRAHDIAVAYASERKSFGHALGDHQGIGYQLADNHLDLHIARLVTRDTAATLDSGKRGSLESSRAKVIVSEALFRVGDRCVQVLGGRGLSTDTAVAAIFAELRAFRIYDGPSEVHRMSIAKKILAGKA
jgi:acyl-CoA dehydrogenase